MPNHVINDVVFRGHEHDLLALREFLDGGSEQQIDFNRVAPVPPILRLVKTGGTVIDGHNVSKWREIRGVPVRISPDEVANWQNDYGADNWYDWCWQNWGTKWNAYDIAAASGLVDRHGRNRSWKVQFTTAWASPGVLFERLVELFPGIAVDVEVSGEVDKNYSYNVRGSRYEQ